MDLISIIIPIYNVEKYIGKCLNSVVSQSYSNIEIICIDDGSYDHSSEIIHAYDDPRIAYYFKKNGGLSDARNFGIDHSNGEYLFFLDADDYLLPDAIEKLYYALKKNQCDIAIGDYIPVDEEGNEIVENKEKKLKTYVSTGKQIYQKFWNYVPLNTAWAKLFKRDYFDRYKFPFGKLNEDEFIIYKIIYEADKVITIEDDIYAYVMREKSIMNSKFSQKNLDALEAFDDRIEYMREASDDQMVNNVRKLILNWIAQYAHASSDRELEKRMVKLFDDRYKKYRDVIDFKGKVRLELEVHFPYIYKIIRHRR